MKMIDMNKVEAFYDYYHAKKLTHPELYMNNPKGDTVTVVLPAALLDYANAAAGHSGFGAGARPVGIRRKIRGTAEDAIADIFSSPESLAAFIESSECNAAEYIANIREEHYRKGLGIDDRTAESQWKDLHAKYDIKELSERFGRDNVITARHALTVNEFELRFGLAA
jgi:hypothetical protein